MLAKKITDSYDFISEAEYLEGEQYAKVRHEYVDGKVYAMAGTSRRHSRIAFNIAFHLRLAAREMPCEIHLADVKVRAERAKSYFYPDVIIGCEGEESNDYYLENPCLIVEVTSPSTEWKDRHQKTVAYQRLASLQAYLIVAQERVQVTVYYRDANGAWDVALYDQLEQTIPLPCPTAAELSVAAIYEGIDGLIVQPTMPAEEAEIPSESDSDAI